MSQIETERKFLVLGSGYKQQACSHDHIRQGYLMTTAGRTVRVRVRGGKGYLTIKGPPCYGNMGRYEFETEIPLDDAEKMLLLCLPGVTGGKPAVIEKERWLVPMPDKHIFEVDEFEGDNDGLVMAEVELRDPGESFLMPDFIGREVTDDKRFYNAHLLKNPFILWRDSLPEWRGRG